MPIFRLKQIATICVPLLFLLLACTTTITRTKNPVFAAPIDSLQARLNGLMIFKHINLDGKEVTTNGKRSTQLEIDVLGGKDVPEDNGRMKTLAHSLAVEVKEALKDKNEYDNYTVLFVKVDSSSSVTTRSWKGDTFKSAEL
jgi:hypothetical protein